MLTANETTATETAPTQPAPPVADDLDRLVERARRNGATDERLRVIGLISPRLDAARALGLDPVRRVLVALMQDVLEVGDVVASASGVEVK